MKGLEQANSSAFFSRQRGAALIVIMFIIGLALAALLIKSYNADSLKLQQQEKTMAALGQAKEALIAWAVSYDKPGQLPWPDRREVTPPSNYDGQSDCSNVNFNLLNSLGEPNFLGQIPRIDSTAPCESYTGVGSFKDSSGNNLWFAVSRNLVRNYAASSDPVINPGLVATSPHPWLVVRNSAGQVVSDRVAVVIIAPGLPLAGQNRSSLAPAPSAYLESITIGANTYSNFNYDSDNHEFIMGGDATLSNTFNDRLVFITIDELIYAVEKRAANEIIVALNAFRADNGGEFPYAASLGTPSDHLCKPGNAAGLLPLPKAPLVHSPNATLRTCDFEYAGARSISCSNGFADLESVAYWKAGGFISASAGCTISGNSCICTAAGSCVDGPREFECDVNADCTANVGGIARVTPRCGHEFTVADGDVCSINADGSLLSCSPTASWIGSGGRQACGEAAFLPYLPAWITINLWQDYFYYRNARSEVDNLTTGPRDDITAMLIGTGAPLLAPAVAASRGADQIRPSCAVNDYLDSNENANEDLIFDPYYLRRNINYNDRVYIVSP